MKKIMIINETDLDMRDVGNIIQYIQDTYPEQTNYYGKVEATTVICCNKEYKIQIRYLKNYVEWRFMYGNNTGKRN